MDIREAFIEAGRGIASGAARPLLLTVAFVAAGLLIAAPDVAAVVGLEQRAVQFQSAKANITVLTAEDQVDAIACTRLGELSGVHVAAVTPRATTVRAAQLPGQLIEVTKATPSMAQLLNVQPVGPGVWVPEALASDLAAKVGSPLTLGGKPTRVAAIYHYPDDGRRPGLSYAIIEPTAAVGTFSECWIQQWPLNATADTLIYSSLSWVRRDDSATKNISVGLLNGSFGSTFDGQQLLRQRPTGFLVWVAPVLGLVISTTFLRLRRLELASARHAGVGSLPLWFISTIETGFALLSALVLVLPTLFLLLLPIERATLWPVAVFAARPLFLLGVGAMVGVAVGVWTTREAQLFAYFKSR